MIQTTLLPLPNDEVERFRARHRRLCRDHHENSPPNAKIESLDEDDGRTRKISAKWRERRLLQQTWHQHEDGYWPKSAGTEMHLGFNAFDFTASPEAFNNEPDDPIEIKDLSAEIIDLQYDTFMYDEDLVQPGESEIPSYKTIPNRRYEAVYGKSEGPIDARNQPPEVKLHQKPNKELSMADVAKQVTSMSFNSASLWGRNLPDLRHSMQQLSSLNRDGVWGGPTRYTTDNVQQHAFY
ncbi:hypothetical protein PF005_g22055 [Phytophthora fragariae]|uniref:Uncharacterized protein n=1 Tax=Phytophthora fragariae TaxID=53985 RepID=A0A6A4CBY1_9STRA|nr:hypothetical protein PF003_g79 [Phytophthora fragariae]KAE8921290.1 hypothetical protein PF009_g28426 [Phytophthora fragariae]KAE9008181.1 hypothetical protein PF011_g10797 [Phytophthora fragariae]KAE9082914.1 hypothetical protein PF007_g22116 [Phytophthora fragariae]KAE9083003.1 hypothetical protein PF010_g21368 [Phytophthora fragariae]